jgi:hypothetical protein
MTSNFKMVLGRGGFGCVYDGVLPDGTQVAVKLLAESSSQGFREFLTEVINVWWSIADHRSAGNLEFGGTRVCKFVSTLALRLRPWQRFTTKIWCLWSVTARMGISTWHLSTSICPKGIWKTNSEVCIVSSSCHRLRVFQISSSSTILRLPPRSSGCTGQIGFKLPNPSTPISFNMQQQQSLPENMPFPCAEPSPWVDARHTYLYRELAPSAHGKTTAHGEQTTSTRRK